jgi:lipoic acid synthetase
MKVDRYVLPEEFAKWKEVAEGMGFLYVASGPLVRSSYKAGEFFIENVLKKRRAALLQSNEVDLSSVTA